MTTPTTTIPTTDSPSSNSSHLIPTKIVNDVCFRFLEGVPQDYRKDNMRIFFEIEMAHWFYLDNYCDNPEFPECKNISFKDFARLIFKQCLYLKSRAKMCDKIIDEFYFYKQHIPTNGAIMIDKTLEYVLLVQGYFASTNSWGFPKGKVNECEKPIDCAIREVCEETGYDIKEKVNEKRSYSRFTNGRAMTQLFVATDVEMDYKFEPHANKEIRKIQWFRIDLLPRDRNDFESSKKINMKPSNFYNVVPFVNDIHQFVKKEKSRRAKKAKKDQQQLQSQNGSNSSSSSKIITPNQQSFTGETFLKLFNSSHPQISSPLPSPTNNNSSLNGENNKTDTILVYTAPIEDNNKLQQQQQQKKPASTSSTPQIFSSISPGPNIDDQLLPLTTQLPLAPPPPRPASSSLLSSSSAATSSQTFLTCEEATLAIAKLLDIRPKNNNKKDFVDNGKSQTSAPNLLASNSVTPQQKQRNQKLRKSPIRYNNLPPPHPQPSKNQTVFY